MTNIQAKNRVLSAFFSIIVVLPTTHYSLQTQVANAQSSESTAAETSVTIFDLGIINPGTLPTSPFYFLKQWGRTFRRAVTFDPVKKAELELKIANTKAAELKKVEEIEVDNPEAIQNALENYQKSQERLKVRFESLKENSQNQNIDKLLDDFADKVIKHDKIFDEIAQKFQAAPTIQTVVAEAKQKIEETFAKAAEKDKPAEFAAKIEKALISSAKGEFEQIRSIEMIDRFNVRAPVAVQKSLERLRDDFSSQFQENIKSAISEQGAQAIEEKLQALPGNASRRAVIFEEMKTNVGTQTQRVFDATNEFFANKVVENKDAIGENKDILAQKAREQFMFANEVVKKLVNRVAGGSFSEAINNLVKNAADRLEEARKLLDSGEWEKVFGAARSAEALARNALQMIDKEFTSTEDFEQIFRELEARMTKYANIMAEKGITADIQPKAYEFLANVKKHLGFARDAFAKGDLIGAKTHIGHVKGYLQGLGSFVEWFGKGEGYEKVYTTTKPMPASTITIPAPKPIESKPYVCGITEQNLKELDLMLRDGKISKEDYERKYAAYKMEIEKCKSENDSGKRQMPIDKPTIISPDEIVNVIPYCKGAQKNLHYQLAVDYIKNKYPEYSVNQASATETGRCNSGNTASTKFTVSKNKIIVGVIIVNGDTQEVTFESVLSTTEPKPVEGKTTEPVPVSEIKIISPNGGEQWVVRKEYTIQWKVSGNIGKTLMVTLEKDGKYWSTLGYPDTYSNTIEENGVVKNIGFEKDGGSMKQILRGDWYPGENTGFVVVIVDSYNKSVGDKSDSAFTIIR